MFIYLYMYRQSIECNMNSLLSYFKLNYDSVNFQFSYKCVAYTQSLTCTDWQSDSYYWNGGGSVTVAALANSDIACKSAEALRSVKWNSYNGYMRTNWKCCSFASTNSAPTMAPSTTCVYYTGWKWRPPIGSTLPIEAVINVGDYLLRSSMLSSIFPYRIPYLII